MDLGDNLSESWKNKDTQAPVNQTESLTLTKLSEIGEFNDISVREVYIIITSAHKYSGADFSSHKTT